MITITFSRALVAFAAILAIVYIILLLTSKKSTQKQQKRHAEAYAGLVTTLSVLSVVSVALLLLTDFREGPAYYVLVSGIVAFVLILAPHAASSPRTRSGLLFTVILWNVLMTWDTLPSTGIAIGEGTQMIKWMMEEKRWEFGMAHNPSYNPLPTVALIFSALSFITGVPWYSYLLNYLFYILLIAVYDITLYLLTKRVTSSTVAALLAPILVAMTPETNIMMHPYQWLSSLLVLLSTLFIIRRIAGSISRADIFCLSLIFVSAILTHPTAAVILPFPLMALLAGYLALYIPRLDARRLEISPMPIRTFAARASIFLTVITFTRAMYTFGYLEYIMPAIEIFVKEMFFEYVPGIEGEVKPLYDRAMVSPIQAYPWAIVIAVASALIFAELFKRKIKRWHLALYATGATYIILGYLGGAYVKVSTSGFYRGMYTAIPFMIPLAGLVLGKTLKSNRWVAILSSVLLLAATVLAVQDPNVSPRQYAAIREGFLEITGSHVEEAFDVSSLLQPTQEIAIGPALDVGGIRLRNTLADSLSLLSSTSDISTPKIALYNASDITYCALNRVYDSNRNNILSHKQ